MKVSLLFSTINFMGSTGEVTDNVCPGYSLELCRMFITAKDIVDEVSKNLGWTYFWETIMLMSITIIYLS